MQLKSCFIVLTCLSATLVACEQKAASSITLTTPAPAVAHDTVLPQATLPLAEPTYEGTYTVQDTAVCSLSITITKQADTYSFTTSTTRGLVQIEKQDSETYFTFLGLKGTDPKADVEAVWQDTVLVIQNYGNSMNEYLRFAQCDAKYLELVRQQQ
ncbi:hypothetical protein [Hymenobacter volaticus]|uniref:Lipoprotein n=1 Tax=Hymenobacter volaticus TaxID=2932254 RepID=A0ABY4G7X0_9BACT|nr:hypothetical protein [Hymenobacter volaticus]UOQ67004.1 hypothetical protein MUN86_03600 [Hymenobacter volaticus]